MARYFAYEILTDGSSDMGVDTDPAALWTRLADDLNDANGDSDLESVRVGMIQAENIEEALNEIRAGNWLKDAHNGFLQTSYIG